MDKKNSRMVGFLGLVFLIISACSFPSFAVSTQEPGKVFTAAALTIIAEATEYSKTLTQTPIVIIQTLTSEIQATSTMESTLEVNPIATDPEATVEATTVAPTEMTPTLTTDQCNLAKFIQDVSVPDGSVFVPDIKFSKTWRIQNTGTCTWKGYDVVFVRGDAMGQSAVVPLDLNVEPGQTIEFSLDFTTPMNPGSYKAYWQLRDANGFQFGLGADRQKSFWVDIVVAQPKAGYVYDFSTNYCKAEWKTGSGKITCYELNDAKKGAVWFLAQPVLEGDRNDDDPTIVMRPELVENGWISGEYPAYKVQQNDRFRAYIGCVNEARGCFIQYRLDYRSESGAIKTLGTWLEEYDGEITEVDVDLSELQGKTIKFIFYVNSVGSPENDQAFWLGPRIVRPAQ